MRRYDDQVDVRKGMVPGARGPVEGPEQFLWRGRLWKVRDVVAHWVETGPWWQTAAESAGAGAPGSPDLLAEREVWRVEAGRGATTDAGGQGLFDLAFDWAQGSWQLTRCLD